MMSEQPWEVLSCKKIADGSPWVRVFMEHVRLPNGVEIADYYRIEMASYVKIFAVTSQNEVVMNQQYKHGPGIVSLELPAGVIDEEADDNNPLIAAKRELLEETGMVAEQWMPLGKYFIDGNRGCGWVYGFLARDVHHQQDPQLEPTELLETRLLTVSEVRSWWLAGKITNVVSSALIGLALAHLEQKT